MRANRQVSKANIPYDSRGLPIFDDVSEYTTTIDKTVTYEKQLKQATLDLRDAINTGKVDSGQFTAAQLARIQAGSEKIPGFTWHHNAQGAPSNMQFVPTKIHSEVSHLGQGSLSQGK
jgi:filamentous hemagglutinin